MPHPVSILLPSANVGGYSARRWRACAVLAGIAGLALAFVPVAANAFGPPPQPVPFIGCSGDGQTGPVDASETTGAAPRLAGDVASRLAYYAFRSVGDASACMARTQTSSSSRRNRTGSMTSGSTLRSCTAPPS